MASVSHRPKGTFEDALAGGGEAATSRRNFFGAVLRVLVASGAAAVAFGAPMWMGVATVAVVSLLYRHVTLWILYGSGGGDRCEQELGGWRVKVNATITASEHTPSLLVRLAALVTSLAERAGGLPDVRSLVRASALPVVVARGEAESGNRHSALAMVIAGLAGSADDRAMLVISVPGGDAQAAEVAA